MLRPPVPTATRQIFERITHLNWDVSGSGGSDAPAPPRSLPRSRSQRQRIPNHCLVWLASTPPRRAGTAPCVTSPARPLARLIRVTGCGEGLLEALELEPSSRTGVPRTALLRLFLVYVSRFPPPPPSFSFAAARKPQKGSTVLLVCIPLRPAALQAQRSLPNFSFVAMDMQTVQTSVERDRPFELIVLPRRRGAGGSGTLPDTRPGPRVLKDSSRPESCTP